MRTWNRSGKIKNLLKWNKNIGHFAWRPSTFCCSRRHQIATNAFSSSEVLGKAFCCLYVLCASISLSPNRRIYMKFDNGDLYEKLLRNSTFNLNRVKISGTMCEDLSMLLRCQLQYIAPPPVPPKYDGCLPVWWYQAARRAERVFTLREHATILRYT